MPVKKSIIKPARQSFIPDPLIVKEILLTGISTFMGTIGNSIALGLLNQRLAKYGGTPAITSMGAINSIFTLFFMPLMGLQQGMQPIAGFNHGAELHHRVNRTLKLSMLWAVIFSTIVFIFLKIFPEPLLSLFISPESGTMSEAKRGLIIYFMMLPLISVNILGISFLQATAQSRKALILSMLRQFLCLIPLLFILPEHFGLTGVWSSVPTADGIAILVTAITLVIDYRNRKSSMNNKIGLELKIAN